MAKLAREVHPPRGARAARTCAPRRLACEPTDEIERYHGFAKSSFSLPEEGLAAAAPNRGATRIAVAELGAGGAMRKLSRLQRLENSRNAVGIVWLLSPRREERDDWDALSRARP